MEDIKNNYDYIIFTRTRLKQMVHKIKYHL